MSLQKKLTINEAAEALGVSRRTLDNWRCKNRGPRWLKVGRGHSGRVYYPLEEIEAYLARCLRGSEDDGHAR
jgi:predicted DNA-binding transcriptional regulator AlpA